MSSARRMLQLLVVAPLALGVLACPGGSDPNLPPEGVSLVAAATAGTGANNRFGRFLSMAADGEENPLLAYVVEDLNDDGDYTDNTLFFVRWERAAKKWSTPLKVDTVGKTDLNSPFRLVSLARDASNGTLGIAYVVGYDETWLALSSDGGATWNRERVDVADPTSTTTDSEWAVREPVLGLSSGKVHLGYWHHCIRAQRAAVICASGVENHAVVYLERTGTSGAFTETLAPLLPDTEEIRGMPVGFALDSEGKPGFAYFLSPPFNATSGRYTTSLAFWRPGAAPVKVTDSNDVQNDVVSVSLAFDGTRPRLAYHQRREAADEAPNLWLASSPDGNTWSSVPIPRDGKHTTSWYQSLALHQERGAAIAAYFSGGAGAGNCGGPKLSRSSDLTNWTTCSPDTRALPDFAGREVNLRYTSTGKLWLAFEHDGTNDGLAKGVAFWREP